MDSDKVLVMNFGEAVEFNHPYILLQNNGIFTQMVQQTGTSMAEHLKTVAKEVSTFFIILYNIILCFI